MKQTCRLVVLAAALVGAAGETATAQGEVFIEYTVSGSATASGREVDVVMCSVSEDGLNVHSMGDWVFTFEAESAELGEHVARFRVAAPDDVTALHDDNFRTDDRLTGEGTISLESAGRGQMDVRLFKVMFAATGLSSTTGATIDVKGTLVCPVF